MWPESQGRSRYRWRTKVQLVGVEFAAIEAAVGRLPGCVVLAVSAQVIA